jgi:hypothetical protein
MEKLVEWKIWSAEQIASFLPRLLTMVETSREDFLPDQWQKNLVAVEALRKDPPSLVDIRNGVYLNHLTTIGIALDLLASNIVKRGGRLEQSMWLFQAAHELFRGGNVALHPNKHMRVVLNHAWKALLLDEIPHLRDGEITAGSVLDAINTFVTSAWGEVPSQLELSINETLLNDLEDVRLAGENDKEFYERFVRENIETVLALEVPTRLERIQDHWREIGEYVAPAATRSAVRALKRPQSLSTLLPRSVWAQIQQAVEQGDVQALGSALAGAKSDLEANLCLRLTAKAEYREPNAEIQVRQQPDRHFVEAHDLLFHQNPDALRKFQNIHLNRSNNPQAKEWYAYALSRFGTPADIHDIILLLEDAIQSPFFRQDIGWTARWNLACALRQLRPRAHEALDVLLPILKNDNHSSEVFELCLLWTIEQDRGDVLSTLLLQSHSYEAHLLAILNYIETHPEGEFDATLRDHFRRISRILRNPDHIFPNPKERLEFNELERLTNNFIETSLVTAGIEWFAQRFTFANERRNWKNWESAAQLYERTGDFASAWRCLCSQWYCTADNQKLPPVRKTPTLRQLLSWAERYNFEEDALRLLKRDWQKTTLSENDVRMFELRLRKIPAVAQNPGRASEPNSQPQTEAKGPVSPNTEKPQRPNSLTPAEAEPIIQRLAGAFVSVNNAPQLAEKANDALLLINATLAKKPEITASVVAPLREVIRLAREFHAGVNDQEAQELARRMRDQLVTIQGQLQKQSLPYEITRLAEACERVIQNLATRVKAVPSLNISSLESLKPLLDTPETGETYVTRLFIRLTNPGPEEMTDISVSFSSPSPHIRFLEETTSLARLAPEAKAIVEGPLEVSDGVEESVKVRVYASYKYGGVARAHDLSGYVPVRPIGLPIPVKERYMPDTPVTIDRPDLFHGRDKELKDLLSTFAGGKLLRLYFVNGIRRVGKSTLIEQMSGRCDKETLPLLFNLQEALGDSNMTTIQLVRQLTRSSIEQVSKRQDLPPLVLSIPDSSAFELDSPWVVFDDFLENLRRQAQCQSILICFDEVQYLVARIANSSDPLSDAFLAWMRGKVMKRSNILVICTGSEPYAVMRKRYDHTLWGNMEAYNVSFVEKGAMEKIAAYPVKPDGVFWLAEAMDRLWDITEGHPWLTQTLAEKVAETLNTERRRLVGPTDVDRAVSIAMQDERYSSLWWNEEEHQVTATHRQIAFLILQHQTGSRQGLAESELYEFCQKSGIRTPGRYLEEMRSLEVLTDIKEGTDPRWRIKGGFLEQYLMTLMNRASYESGAKQPLEPDQPLALMLDWENIKISLLDLLKAMPTEKAAALRQRLNGSELATALLTAATRHGLPRQKWAVANWDRPTFAGDQAALRRVRYMPDMAGEHKADASDHVLREKIHYVLREQPEIHTYIIGTGDADFGEVIKTLQEKGKHVVLWATKKAINDVYKHYLSGPDRIQIEWLEDILFEEPTTN